MNGRIERQARAIPSLEKLGAALSLVVAPAMGGSAQDEPGSERLRAVEVEATTKKPSERSSATTTASPGSRKVLLGHTSTPGGPPSALE